MKTKSLKTILISNIGSMSRKYFVFTYDKNEKKLTELFNIQFDKKEYHTEIQNLDEALLTFFKIAKRDFNFSISDLDIIAERVVAAGEYFLEHRVIDEKYLVELEQAKRYDIIHTEDLIKEIQKIILMKEVCQKNKIKVKFKLWGLSDSEFHKTIPEVNYVYGLQAETIANQNHKIKIRKYGYHGISMSEINRDLQKKQKVIAIHLGGGGSVTAIFNKKSLYNSFGMTPVSGLMNMTRVGEIDPLVILDIYDNYKKYFSLLDNSDNQFEQTKKEIYEQSGLLALTGHADMRDIIQDLALPPAPPNRRGGIQSTKRNSEFAIEVYLNRVVKEVGGALALLGACDQLVLTGSILEKSEIIRKKLLNKLTFLNLSAENIQVIPTAEEKEMARIIISCFI